MFMLIFFACADNSLCVHTVKGRPWSCGDSQASATILSFSELVILEEEPLLGKSVNISFILYSKSTFFAVLLSISFSICSMTPSNVFHLFRHFLTVTGEQFIS